MNGADSVAPVDPGQDHLPAPERISNPFATRYIKPGAIPFMLERSSDIASLVGRLRQANWWGQVIGPHGMGKSSLLKTLIPYLTEAGREVILVRLTACSSPNLHEILSRFNANERPPGNRQLIIDGFEQLRWWQRTLLRCTVHRWGSGLLVTAHRSIGLDTLIRLRYSFETFERVVARLLGNQYGQRITREDVRRVFSSHNNIRDGLFGLYDLYERRRQQTSQQASVHELSVAKVDVNSC